MKRISALLVLSIVVSVFVLAGCKLATESPKANTNTTQQ